MWEFEDGPDRGGFRAPVALAKVPAPITTVWPVQAEEDGVGRCRLCGIVAIIRSDQLCGACKPEVIADDPRDVHTCVRRVTLGEPAKDRVTHTGHERHGHYEVLSGCRECNGVIVEGWCEDCGLEQQHDVEVWMSEDGCGVCGDRRPVPGSTCPGPQDQPVMRGAWQGKITA